MATEEGIFAGTSAGRAGIVRMRAMILVPAQKRSPTMDPGIAGRRALLFGAYAAFLCSVHAGYITAQNLLIDGGSYPATY